MPGTSCSWNKLHVNADKAEYMYFNQRGDISTLKGGNLKLVDKFTYLGSNECLINRERPEHVTSKGMASYHKPIRHTEVRRDR